MNFKKRHLLPRQWDGLFAAVGVLLVAVAARSEDATAAPERVSISLHDPSRPALVKVKVSFGAIIVKGYDGKEIVVETRSPKGPPEQTEKSARKSADQAPGAAPKAPTRAESSIPGVKIEEDDNVVTVKVDRRTSPSGLVIQVPFKTSLQLGSPVDGAISVENVEGEIEASNVNGGIVLTGISGSVVAHSVNGRVQARLEKYAPGKPMSVSTVNGGIDVTLPPDTAANVKMTTLNGRLENDFAIESDRPAGKTGRPGPRPPSGKVVSGPINGGGPDFQFRTVNGNVHLRRSNVVGKKAIAP
jgi:hypothetical protein